VWEQIAWGDKRRQRRSVAVEEGRIFEISNPTNRRAPTPSRGWEEAGRGWGQREKPRSRARFSRKDSEAGPVGPRCRRCQALLAECCEKVCLQVALRQELTLVKATGFAHRVWQLGGAAVRAAGEVQRLERVVRASHVALGTGDFFAWDCHDVTSRRIDGGSYRGRCVIDSSLVCQGKPLGNSLEPTHRVKLWKIPCGIRGSFQVL
jgi:hypothetical protein